MVYWEGFIPQSSKNNFSARCRFVVDINNYVPCKGGDLRYDRRFCEKDVDGGGAKPLYKVSDCK